MSRNQFGWSYPPGAENDPNAPWNQDDGVTKLQEDILTLLDAANLPQNFIDDIIQMVAWGETARQDREDAQLVDQLAEAEMHKRYEDSTK